MNEKLHFLYKERIESDIQNIYREFESYSAIIDSRINRLKNLTERQEANVKAWENIQNEMKKAKTGKEVLAYIESQKEKSYLTSDDIENVKKQITDELKTYLALKLNLDQSAPARPSANRSPRLAPEPGQEQKIERKSASTAPREIIKPLPEVLEEDDFNVAELIVSDLAEDQFFRPSPSPKQQSAVIPKPEPPRTEEAPTENKFIKTLASIGKGLTPLFLKPDSPAPVVPGDSGISPNLQKRSNFSDMIQTDLNKEARAKPRTEDTTTNSIPAKMVEPSSEVSEESVRIQTTLAPNELVSLIESLRSSKARPEALKSLLAKGFDLSQIAEISNIPYSDLELTRNLYRI